MGSRNFILILIPFLTLVIICLFIISKVNTSTRDQIAFNRIETELKMVREVMPLEYDNELVTDLKEINDNGFFKSNTPVNIYLARSGEDVIGLVFMPVMASGYNGFIELAIGLDTDGVITGVRVNKHKETEGYGSHIHQDNSDWINGFINKSINNTERKDWAVESDGGSFDQISGATISPRGVINAVEKTLDYYDIYKEDLKL
jgi:electron transport complex protein RnfG